MLIDNSALITKSCLIHSLCAADIFVQCYQEQRLGFHCRPDYLDASRLFLLETSPCAAVVSMTTEELGTSSGYGGLTLSVICPILRPD